MPEFAHLPLLLKPSGKGKLSKRDGDQLGFPVFPMFWNDKTTGETAHGYREDGYLPDAFVNLLALLGWNPGTEQEIFTMQELIEQFDLEKISKHGAKFSPEKAKWFNQQYVKSKSNAELAKIFMPVLKDKGIEVSIKLVEKVAGFAKERIVLLPDFWEQTAFFFETPKEFNQQVLKKNKKENTSSLLEIVCKILESINETDFTTENTENKIKEYIQENNLSFGVVMNPLRLALTGTGGGPHLFDIVSTIGKHETILRIKNGVKLFGE